MNEAVGKAEYMWNEMRQNRWGLDLVQNKNNLNNKFPENKNNFFSYIAERYFRWKVFCYWELERE